MNENENEINSSENGTIIIGNVKQGYIDLGDSPTKKSIKYSKDEKELAQILQVELNCLIE